MYLKQDRTWQLMAGIMVNGADFSRFWQVSRGICIGLEIVILVSRHLAYTELTITGFIHYKSIARRINISRTQIQERKIALQRFLE